MVAGGKEIALVKVKIVWTMLQVLSLLGVTYQVEWPETYDELVQEVSSLLHARLALPKLAC